MDGSNISTVSEGCTIGGTTVIEIDGKNVDIAEKLAELERRIKDLEARQA